MKRTISKSPEAGFAVRICMDMTAAEVGENLKGMEAAIQNGVAALEEKKIWAEALR